MAPLELYEKLYVKNAFLNSDHGQIPCEQCHGGNPDDADWQTAHEEISKDPTFPDPTAVCGDCHGEITKSVPASHHYSLAPVFGAIEARASTDRPETMAEVRKAQSRHCGSCHASCGQCHISRPAYVGGGFLSGHQFIRPPMETVCAACHGGRVFSEYTGVKEDYPADVHFISAEMACSKCHSSAQIHADGSMAANRFDAPNRPSCRNCHEHVQANSGTNKFHAQHADDLACQVCHSQANKNCFSCHVGTDEKGLPYFKCDATRAMFKIGRNPLKSNARPEDYVVLRHAPVSPKLFDAYTPNALSRFDRQPTWKASAPHNIQKRTARNSSCNACHGRDALFLDPHDMNDWERKANALVIVPANQRPKPLLKEDQ